MNLEERINQDLKEAMKLKDQAALRGIRAIKAAILLFKTDGSGEELDSEKSIKLLQKLVKQRQDSLDIYNKQGREDLAVVEREEIDIIQRYLPEQLSREAIVEKVNEIIAETGASGMKDMGKVMGMASQKMSGQADGKIIAEIVKSALGS
jgi:uncharacterized protein YqeY